MKRLIKHSSNIARPWSSLFTNRIKSKNIVYGIMLCALSWQNLAYASHEKTNGDELSNLSIEELLNVDVVIVDVLGTHTHIKGEWMLGYTYATMHMEGNRIGTSQVSTSDVLNDFNVAPIQMHMEMHMGMLMYAPSDDLTLLAMLPYKVLSMDHITRTGVNFTTKSKGIGDVQLGLTYSLRNQDIQAGRILYSGKISLPTGSIDATDFLANPAIGKRKLPYPMQLGSGTFDLSNALTYIDEKKNWIWGAEINSVTRLGTNSNDYSLGDQYGFKAWMDWKLKDWIAPNLQIEAKTWGNINGADSDLNSAVVPTADPLLRGGDTVSLSPGIILFAPHGQFKGQRFAVKATIPLYRKLKGPQLENDWGFSAGWQWVF